MSPPDAPNSADGHDVTVLLHAMAAGDSAARSQLLDRLYGELRTIANRVHAQHGSRGHTLQPTAVVHEAFLKLVDSKQDYDSRRHFLCVAARAMRQVLLNYARDRAADKRGGGRVVLQLDGQEVAATGRGHDALELEEALQALESVDERQARIVELRYFAGLGVEETAAALQVSVTTVKNEWRMARAELARFLQEPRDGADRSRG